MTSFFYIIFNLKCAHFMPGKEATFYGEHFMSGNKIPYIANVCVNIHFSLSLTLSQGWYRFWKREKSDRRLTNAPAFSEFMPCK